MHSTPAMLPTDATASMPRAATLLALFAVACSPTAGVVGDDGFASLSGDTFGDGSTTVVATTSSGGGGSTSSSSTASDDEGVETTAAPIFDVGAFDVPMLPPGTCECAPHTDLILLLSAGGDLLSFDPESLAFETLVPTIMDETGDPVVMPYSIAVSRSGRAWVQRNLAPGVLPGTMALCSLDINQGGECEYADGFGLFGWDINGTTPGTLGLGNYGTAFVTRDEAVEGEPCEDLFLHSYRTEDEEGEAIGDLARMDFDTMRLVELAATDYGRAELTGTGDGRLFAFGGAAPAKLVEYDKATGAPIETVALDGLELTNAWAVAFWGGDFYFFTGSDTTPGVSKVSRYDYDGDLSLEVIVDATPTPIVGAGTSTCVATGPQG